MSARAAWFPLSASSRDGRHPTGTGFLLIKERRLFLVTAAHVPVEAQPTDDWSAWPEDLLIFRQDRFLTVPLFRGLPVGSVPRFIYVGRGGGFIQDFLAMEFGLDALAAGNVFEGFATVDAASMRFASPGEMVRGFGYPLLGEKWPSSEVDAFQGLFRGYEGVLAEADAPVRKGHSGGPVFRADGAWIGMTIGTTKNPTGASRLSSSLHAGSLPSSDSDPANASGVAEAPIPGCLLGWSPPGSSRAPRRRADGRPHPEILALPMPK